MTDDKQILNPSVMLSDECADNCADFFKNFILQCRTAGLLDRWRADWWRYHNLEEGNKNISNDLIPDGVQGEKVRMSVNLARNIIEHRHTMITSARPTVDPFAENMDPESLRQVDVARGVADYYLTELGYGDAPKSALLMADVLGMSYTHGRWDASAGKLLAAPVGDQGPTYIFQGEPMLSTRGPSDVAFDIDVQEWTNVKRVVVREWEDKFDLAARHPEFKEQIEGLPASRRQAGYDAQELPRFASYQSTSFNSNLIEVHYAYFWRTASNPHGRMLVYIPNDAEEIVLSDEPLPYDRPPVFRYVSSEALQTPIGMGMMATLAQLQQCSDKVWSAISTRIFASGVSNFLVDREANVSPTAIEGGNNWVEYDRTQGGGPPVTMLDNFQIKPEMFKGLELLTQSAELVSAMNATARGSPPPGISAGVAIAQLEAKAMQFASTLEKSYVEGLERVTMFLFDALRLHPNEMQPRVIHIVGSGERAKVVDFFAKDISGIRKVRVTIGNPMTRTVSGRFMMADYLRNSSNPITSEQMMSVLDTGRLDPVVKPGATEMMLIYTENERLSDPTGASEVVVMRGQNHALHIKVHLEVLNNPDVIFDPNVQQRVTQHLQEHEQFWMMGDPLLGIALGQLPMGAGAMGPPQAQPAPGAPPGKPAPQQPPQKNATPPNAAQQHAPNGQHANPPHGNFGELKEVMDLPQMTMLNPRPTLSVKPGM